MAKIQIPFVGESYAMPAKQLDSQTCINWYVVSDATGKYPAALFPTDGLSRFAEIQGKSIIRGMLELNDVLYVAAGNEFYTMDRNGNYTSRGNLKLSTGNVRMVPNKTQIFISEGSRAFVYQYKASAGHSQGDFYEVTATSANVSSPTFTGSGLDDMQTSGTFIGTVVTKYRVEIFTSGNPDTFRWSTDEGDTWQAGGNITGLEQVLGGFGVKIKFAHITGHTKNDKWDFTASPDSTFYVPIIPATQDGYGIYIKQNSNQFYISDLDDFSRVNALSVAQENAWPDFLVAGVSVREELWLIGRTISRIWYDTGADPVPFEPRTNLTIKYGTIAPYSVAVGHNNILFWLGNNEDGGRLAIMVTDYAPQIISKEPINNEWNTYERVDDAIGFVVQKGGHVFYHLIFPTADRTWVYDLTTQMWHEKRSSYLNENPKASDSRLGRWRGNNYAYFGDKHLVGDAISGRILYLDSTNYTDVGTQVLRERTTRIMDKDLQRIFLNSLQIDVEAGEGITDRTGQGYDPQIMLQISKDDGITWGNELWRSIGKKGEYGKRVKWNRLGASRSFTFRIKTSDPVYNVILGAVAELEVSDT